jgi:phage N-6-adenine-methyltransferase
MKQDTNKLAYVGVKPGAVSRNDWYTPEEYITAARYVMGSIGLDPFSSAKANETVQASRYFTADDDALTRSWKGRTRNVWMNPPYSGGLAGKAVDKFLEELEAGHIRKAVVLMNASTDTRWFHKMARKATAMCLTLGRISFETYDGKSVSGNTKGQVFFFYGDEKSTRKFCQRFSEFGIIVKEVV